MTGYPWAQGDELLAADLNAAINAASSSVAAGGPFLPLSGGTVSGPVRLSVSSAQTPASPATPVAFWDALTISGTAPAGVQPYNQFNISDTLDALTHNPGSAPMGIYISHQMSPPATGGRCALNTQLHVVGPTLDFGANPWLLGLQAFAGSNANGGGTSAQSVGALVSYSFQTNLNSGATYYTMAEGFEGGVELFAGSSADYVNGGKIVVVGQGRLSSNILTLDGGSGTAGSQPTMGISIQSLESPHWPIDPAGTILGTHQGGTDPQTAAFGIDFNAITFSTAAFRSKGFIVDGSGFVTVGSATTPTPRIVLSCQNSGSGVGPAIDLQWGGVARGNLGGYSEIFGGAYDSRVVLNGYDGLVFATAGAVQATITSGAVTSNAAMQVGGAAGPTWTTGSAAPVATAPVGSLYSRVGGALGATLYVSRGGSTWAAVAGV